jgi:iron complex outermembrane receptor protein
MRAAIVVAVACLSGAGLCAGQDVQASIRRSTNIPAQELVPALKTLAHERGFHVVFLAEVVGNRRTQGAAGDLTTTEALKKLLEGTNLVYSYLDNKTVTILPVNSNNKSDADAPSVGHLPRCYRLSSDKSGSVTALNQTGSAATARNWAGAEDGPDCAESYSLEKQASRIASIEAAPAQSSDADSNSNAESTMGVQLQEVVVTAQKREQRLMDVPVPVTALAADKLLGSNQLRLQDYYSSVPGLNLALDNRGSPAVAIRGLTTTIYGNPTVATVIDDVSYSGSTGAAFAWAATEFDPNELGQVEVLRGPQGVLYGASSLGGLIKYVTIKPTLDGVSGRLVASGSTVENGSGGYGGSGAVNIPFGETFAVRASAFYRHDPGYIDNVLTGQHGINDADVGGARVASLWRPSSDLSVQLSALYQSSDTNGSPNIETQNVTGMPLGDQQQSYIRNTGGYQRRLHAYSAKVEYTFGPVTLTSISGYAVNTSDGSFDTSNLPVTIALSTAFFGVPYTAWVEHNETRKFSQEIRLTGSIATRADWLLGGFYTDETTDLNGGQYAFQGLSGMRLGHWDTSSGPVTYREPAVFANVTYHFTDRFDIQGGARYSEDRQGFQQTSSFGLSEPSASPELSSKEHSTTYLISPSLHLTPDILVYGRIATGFRPGGINTALLADSVHPRTFSPDKTRNFEIGLKGDFFDRALTLDASIYSIDWKDIQITVSDTTTTESYATNLGQARSRGVEMSLEGKPATGLTIRGWAAFSDATLTQAFPSGAAIGVAGDRLPYSSRYSGNLEAQQEFPLFAQATGFAKVSATYVGNREGEFSAGFGAGRQVYPSYTTLDLLAGAREGSWSAKIYLDNVTDKRGVLAGGIGTLNAYAFTYIRPRTAGLSLAKEF